MLAGAKGVNLWTSFRSAPPQRSARLYRALVERRLASSVGGALLPTRDPFLYTISATASEGTPLATLEQAASAELDQVVSDGITGQELARAKNQLRARLVFETDSVTNIAHQLGFFETVASPDYFQALWGRLEKVTADEVSEAARRYLRPANRTIGWFQPLPAVSGDHVVAPSGDGAGSPPEAR